MAATSASGQEQNSAYPAILTNLGYIEMKDEP
jgi:hypothetical protein